MFIDELKKSLANAIQQTENGANGFSSSGNPILDMNFKMSSYRNLTADRICYDFHEAMTFDAMTAIKFLFFARDVRGGMGERRFFRVAFKHLAEVAEPCAIALIPLIAEYGRWDDVVTLCGSINPVIDKAVVRLIREQLRQDYINLCAGKPISLLAKWMPSENASSAETKAMAANISLALGASRKEYRKLLSRFRKYIDIVERKMSGNDWESIEYQRVPSRANLIYKDAFLKHDPSRRADYLEKVANGEKKINASTLFPHDVLHKYGRYGSLLDATIEALWKALPDYVQGNESTIVVSDGSGSMYINSLGDSEITSAEVANALAIYFAERCKGQFKDQYITFSKRPQLVHLFGTLLNKKNIVASHDECANTNIYAVFQLILNTAIQARMKQEDLPGNVLIISDMEFDSCGENATETLFGKIRAEYEANGYRLPRLAFWNVCGRTETFPVQTNDLGVSLVSGFSPAVVSMVLSGKTDPYEVLLEKLNSERYSIIERSLKNA